MLVGTRRRAGPSGLEAADLERGELGECVFEF